MYRCSAFVAAATVIVAAAVPAHAQVQRNFPADALAGELEFGPPPVVLLNKKVEARLAPGARIRDPHNMLIMSGKLAGSKAKVRYTVDTYGLLMNVWLLTEAESKRLWPKTREEAAEWRFDPIGQTWTKP